jgi:flagellar basal-body rod modification protein FlgD
MADIISSVGASNGTAANYAERVPAQKLGQDEFIKILVAQLTSQDPLNPQKDTEFIGQMAQFSALESTKAMQTEIQTLRANSLIGQTVEVKVDRADNVMGEVTGVDSAKGEPKIIINGVSYPVTDVIHVERGGTFNSPATAPSTN